MISYMLKFGDENLVLLLLGDHPPAPMVSGDPDANQVPVHLIARDPQVIEAVSHWQWQPGSTHDSTPGQHPTLGEAAPTFDRRDNVFEFDGLQSDSIWLLSCPYNAPLRAD